MSPCCLFWATFGLQMRNRNWATMGYLGAWFAPCLQKNMATKMYSVQKTVQKVTRECLHCLECKWTQSGTEYIGTLSRTAGGRTCQSWSSDSPHRIWSEVRADALYPDGSRAAARNYCRNPDSDSRGPWCFTTDPDTEAAYCDVPLCSGKCKNVDQ